MTIFSKKAIMAAAVCGTAALSAQALDMQDFVLAQSRPYTIGAVSPAKDGGFYYQLSADGQKISKCSYKSDAEVAVAFDAKEARGGEKVDSWDGFEMSADESKILLWTNTEPIYRHSFKADYYVYDVRHRKLTKLSDAGGEEIATMSPDGRMVAYVKDNNIYISKLDYGTQVAVTTDGKKNEVINGVPDWVYQEEFGILNSLTWSADNLTLAFIRWDESQVPMYSMTIYGGDCNPRDEYALYPGKYDYKYPVAGEKNSVVSVMAYDVDNRTLKKMQLPMADDDYVPHIAFSPDPAKLMVSKLNRTQNDFSIYAVNPRSTVSREVYNEKSATWVDSELANQVRYYDGFFVIPSDKSGNTHLYQYSLSGALIKQLTSGSYNVTDFYGYDAARKQFYFQATNGELNRVVASVDASGRMRRISPDSGTTAASAFSSDFSYCISNYSDASTPNQYAVTATATGKRVRTLQTNAEYAEKYTRADVPKREFFTMTTDDGVKLNGYMVKPVDFDPSKKYPVIMSQYSGPGSQQVLNKWKLDWEEYFASQGYIVACVDGRGTGGRGKAFESVVYMNLGKYETIDQLAAARHMAQQPYVDKDRIGIWGWSYGGYEALMAMSQPGSKYAAGVAIAPVTSWRFYDTIYAERYMRTPRENEAGYTASSPLEAAAQQKGKLMVMFGSADDNVHIVNEMQYVSRLTSLNKLVDMMVYPNMNHSINGCDVRLPLYRRVLKFFDDNLKSK